MTNDDKPRLRKLLAGLWAMRDKPPMNQDAFEFWWRAVGSRPLAAVADALQQHVNDPRLGAHLPMPADILRRLDGSGDGWLEPNEAWAICPHSEDDTVVWCDEISAAYHTASDLLPDRVAARMAFLDAYRRHVDTARAQGRQPRWAVSLGHDSMQRQAALEQAVMAGRITRDHVARLTMTTPPDITDQRMLQLTDQASGDAARADAIRKIRSLLARASA